MVLIALPTNTSYQITTVLIALWEVVQGLGCLSGSKITFNSITT